MRYAGATEIDIFQESGSRLGSIRQPSTAHLRFRWTQSDLVITPPRRRSGSRKKNADTVTVVACMVTCFATAMARTNAQKRKARLEANREQQTARRQRLASAGIPDTGRLDLALIEGLRFAVSTLGLDAKAGRPPMSAQVLASLIMTTAADILVRRHGFDAGHSRRAIARRMRANPLHLQADYIPSLCPDPAAQAARAAKAATPPLLPQTMSESGH
jgi:hypothetical protein